MNGPQFLTGTHTKMYYQFPHISDMLTLSSPEISFGTIQNLPCHQGQLLSSIPTTEPFHLLIFLLYIKY